MTKMLAKTSQFIKQTTRIVLRHLTPLVATFVITIICGSLLLPFPWQKQQLFYAGYPSGAQVSFQGNVGFRNALNIIVTSTGIPSKLGYYDFHLEFKGAKDSPPGDVSVLQFAVKKNTEFWSYVSSSLGSPSKWLDTDNIGTYEISVGGVVDIKAIPTNVPVDYSAGIVECGFTKDGPCPADLSDMKDMIDVYASPNCLALLIQWFLLLSFWAVVISSSLNLIHQKWRTD